MVEAEVKTAPLKAIGEVGIEKRILVIRERQVMLDQDLADLYGVETRVLVQQVKQFEALS